MRGNDFFFALYREGVDLPVRIFFGGVHPNIYRPNALSFCDLTLEEDDEISSDKFIALQGFDVSVIADDLDDKARELTKALVAVKPRHLVVCAKDRLMSWAPGRGWK